jgi:hypothetical protein
MQGISAEQFFFKTPNLKIKRYMTNIGNLFRPVFGTGKEKLEKQKAAENN